MGLFPWCLAFCPNGPSTACCTVSTSTAFTWSALLPFCST